MSFIPPLGPGPVEAEIAQERQQEIEAHAATYAQRHPDDDGDRGDRRGVIGRALRRVRDLVRGQVVSEAPGGFVPAGTTRPP